MIPAATFLPSGESIGRPKKVPASPGVATTLPVRSTTRISVCGSGGIRGGTASNDGAAVGADVAAAIETRSHRNGVGQIEQPARRSDRECRRRAHRRGHELALGPGVIELAAVCAPGRHAEAVADAHRHPELTGVAERTDPDLVLVVARWCDTRDAGHPATGADRACRCSARELHGRRVAGERNAQQRVTGDLRRKIDQRVAVGREAQELAADSLEGAQLLGLRSRRLHSRDTARPCRWRDPEQCKRLARRRETRSSDTAKSCGPLSAPICRRSPLAMSITQTLRLPLIAATCEPSGETCG